MEIFFDYFHRNSYRCYFLIGFLLALSIGLLPITQEANTNFIFIFLCGFIGVIGMIIPGLSGSYLLLILGNYELLLQESINNFLRSTPHLTYLVIFAAGTISGIIILSKFISWFLKKFKEITLTIIAGFVLGSLIFIWPIKNKETGMSIIESIESPNIQIHLDLLFVMLIGFFSFIIIEYFSNKKYV